MEKKILNNQTVPSLWKAISCYQDILTLAYNITGIEKQSPPSYFIPCDITYAMGIPPLQYWLKNWPLRKNPLWIDCGKYPGFALQAIQRSFPHILFAGNSQTFSSLAQLAQKKKVRFEKPPF